jgi:predicted Rossmann fold nucleotide-binding protein DprA/Smf involved in DNA uptake
MKVRICIAGSRDFNNFDYAEEVIQCFSDSHPEIKQDDVIIVSGGARGADKIGEQLAHKFGLGLDIYPAKWDLYGKSAGYKRNREMAEISDYVFCFWDGKSKGTKHMIDLCKSLGKPTYVIEYLDLPPWE